MINVTMTKGFSAAALGLLRVAVISPDLRVADVDFNVQTTIDALQQARDAGARLALFPELGLTGYSCGDLFRQAHLLDAALQGLEQLIAATTQLEITAVVGLPLALDGRLFNCAAVVNSGRLLGLVPKTYLPSYSEFYEQRWFSPARVATAEQVVIGGQAVPFGASLLFAAEDMPGCVLGIEICEDLWAVEPPSGSLALAGATVILNPSASPEQLGKADYRRALVQQQSARCIHRPALNNWARLTIVVRWFNSNRRAASRPIYMPVPGRRSPQPMWCMADTP